MNEEVREALIDAAECLKELARQRTADALRSEAFQHAGRLEGIVRGDSLVEQAEAGQSTGGH